MGLAGRGYTVQGGKGYAIRFTYMLKNHVLKMMKVWMSLIVLKNVTHIYSLDTKERAKTYR
jgi:hypothetical protein